MNRYDGPVEVGMVFTCPDNDGKLGYRRVRVLAAHPDSGLILDDLPARIEYTSPGQPFRCPEANLRVVFVPEVAAPAEEPPRG